MDYNCKANFTFFSRAPCISYHWARRRGDSRRPSTASNATSGWPPAFAPRPEARAYNRCTRWISCIIRDSSWIVRNYNRPLRRILNGRGGLVDNDLKMFIYYHLMEVRSKYHMFSTNFCKYALWTSLVVGVMNNWLSFVRAAQQFINIPWRNTTPQLRGGGT